MINEAQQRFQLAFVALAFFIKSRRQALEFFEVGVGVGQQARRISTVAWQDLAINQARALDQA